MSVTQDNFFNCTHKDVDGSECAFGMFALVNCATGQLQKASKLPFSIHSVFNFTEYGVYIHFHHCDGVVEMVWNVHVSHRTLPLVTKTTADHPYKHSSTIEAGQAPMTRFGSSCQNLKKIVSMAKSLKEAKKIWGTNWTQF